MIASLLAVLLCQNPPPPPPPPARVDRIEKLRRELEALPPDSPERRDKEAELNRLYGYEEFRRGPEPQSRPARPGGRPEEPLPAPPIEQVRDPEAVKAWLREHEPETARRVERAIEAGRRPEAMRLLSEAEPRMREMAEMKARDPKAYERLQEMRGLERETLDLSERARQAVPADREKAGLLLQEKLGRLFDLREETKAREVAELKRRVADLEKQLETRKASRERIVERRKRELLGERLPDDW